jgi:TolB-like protein/Flp pilus assembly protein TadD
MFADMVGFTALMGRDEDAARVQRDRQREVVGRLVEHHGGEVRQYYGDGTLSLFASAVEAARCAVAIQAELRSPPEVPLRIGIHTGDVVDEGEGVYGDGVNVAARVESLAPVRGVAISDKVFDEIKNHPELTAVSMGAKHLKNVSRPVEVFVLSGQGLPAPSREELRGLEASSADRRPLWRSPRALVVGTIGALLLGSGVVWSLSPPGGMAGGRTAATRDTPSIAVIPFRNMSAEAENAAFFADGLHDDVLTQLAKVGSIDVIARTSVMQFADSELPIPEIARQLGVGAVLEGGVQRIGDRIRLNVQLIDASTDTHLWAETYDRELSAESVFSIQSEVAEAITQALSAVLTGDERLALSEVPTSSTEAYEAYLRGVASMRGSPLLEDHRIAEAAFVEAVALDPEFAVAFARLAYLHLDLYWNALDRSSRRLQLATEALQRAEEIDADHSEVLLSRGYYDYWAFREYSAALAAFAAAQRGLPGDARLYEAQGYVLRRIGSWGEALRQIETAVALDPLNAELLRTMGQVRMQLGELAVAREIFDMALLTESDSWTSHYDRAWVDVLAEGDVDRLRSLASSAVTESVGANPVLDYTRWWVAMVDGDDSIAFEVSASLSAPLERQVTFHPPALLNAIVHQGRGRGDRARAAADSARVALEAALRTRPDDPRVHAALGTAYALLGLADEAVRAGSEAVRLMPVERDAMDGPEFLLQLGRIHALLGDADEAASHVARLLASPSRHSLVSVLLEPSFSELRGHPALAEF